MRVHAIRASNFLTLHDFSADALDSRLNFLVGPNGSGKSTVFRVLRTIMDTVAEFASHGGIPDLRQMHTLGATDSTVDLTINVTFDTPWEQSLLTAFISASLAMPSHVAMAPADGQPQPTTVDGRLAYLHWILDSMAPARVPWLFTGAFCLTQRNDLDNSLRLTYTFQCGDAKMTFVAGSPYFFGSQLTLGDSPDGPIVKQPMGGIARFIELTGVNEQIAALLLGRTKEAPPLFDVPILLHHLAEHQFEFVVETPSLQTPISPAHRRLTELLGQPWSGRSDRRLPLIHIFSLLLQRALVFTNNLRTPLRAEMDYEWPTDERPTFSSLDELDVPLRLFLLKNGDAARRERFSRIRDTFTTLIGSEVGMDVVTTSVPREDAHEGDTNRALVRVDVKALHQQGEVSMVYEGAGRWEALILATLLDESEGRVILLDEPAANLHPGMQRRLLGVLHDVPGQVILSTHSAHLLPTNPDDFHKVLRLYQESDGTQVAKLDSAAPQQVHGDRLEQELASSSDVAALLFASGVILVEGQTETAALERWFVRSNIAAGSTLADHNLVLHAVGSKTAFAFYLRYLRAFHIPWVIICDGDAFAENNSLWRTLADIGELPPFNEHDTFAQRRSSAEHVGVYTPNTSPSDAFEDIPAVRQYLDSQGHSRSKPRDARQLARVIPCPPEVDRILDLAVRRLLGVAAE